MARLLFAVFFLLLLLDGPLAGFGSGLAPAFAASDHKGEKPNRLLKEASPYLRQHAYNPVNWFPWGKEAFDKAKRENKPILLSVGYSTCHWCHVMERESYSNKSIAKLLNDNFVAIKVDRERRPDVDETYILATEIITGRSGWPNNVFLTPDLKPFVGGSYFPPKNFKLLLNEIALRWLTDEQLLRQEGNRVSSLIDRVMSHRVASAEVTVDALDRIVTDTTKKFDTTYGGLGDRPKFPRENLLLFLLDMGEKHHNEAALKAASKTLDGMIYGGIHDQVGGGFHRYSVDRKWLVPHFEKMLYNQAQIGRALVQAYRITAEPRYKRAAIGLFDSVLRDFLSKEGGFYSAFDADSAKADGSSQEGFFYLWTEDQLKKVLGDKDARFASRLYGTSFEGNFEGRNILHLVKPLRQVAIADKTTLKDIARRLKSINARLLKARGALRQPPGRDDKLVTAWNGLMIKALAEAGLTFNNQRYQKAALKAANFFWDRMGAQEGALKHYFFAGAASFAANQADYAALALALVAVHDTTHDAKWLQRAASLATKMDELFLDKKSNDYYMTAAGSGFYRPKTSTDGDLPSGNAIALELFTKLSRRQLDPQDKDRAEAILASISGSAMSQPGGYFYALRVADELLRGESGSMKYLAKGRVRAIARLAPDGRNIKVSITIAKGWHINAHKPLEDYFVPTTLSGPTAGDSTSHGDSTAGSKAGGETVSKTGNKAAARTASQTGADMAKSAASVKTKKPLDLLVSYPKPLKKKLHFNDKPLALYEGDLTISARLAQPAAAAAPGVAASLGASASPGVMPQAITFTAQTCSDKICLEPETIVLAVLH